MDTLTQAALGATVGQAFFARRLGRKANWYGALGGLVPDFDIFFGLFTNEWGELIWHRGPTHALWFGPVVGPLLGWLCWRHYHRKTKHLPPAISDPSARRPPDPGAREALPAWIGLWILALITHPLLDLFTTYGTQLLAPFSRQRFSLDAIAIIDPIYTALLALALLIGWRSRTRPRRAALAAALALGLTTAYLGYCLFQKTLAREHASADLITTGHAPPERLDTYPTLFQPWLRRLVAWYPDHVLVGFTSTLAPRPLHWTRVPRPTDPAIDAVLAHPDAITFRWFADDRLVPILNPTPAGTEVQLDDFRLGYGHNPGRALWGIRAVVDPTGRLIEGPTRYRQPPPEDITAALRHIWHSTFPE